MKLVKARDLKKGTFVFGTYQGVLFYGPCTVRRHRGLIWMGQTGKSDVVGLEPDTIVWVTE